jgi:large subunit ribosomal protein L4
MASVDVTTVAGKKAGTATLDDEIFGIEPNLHVMHQVVTAQLAARRAGTHSTKTRAERRGGGAKPWRQKGTGRARQGSIRSPQWRGGGIAHGPKPRDYSQKTPKKMIKLALRSALSDRAADGKVLVVEGFGFDAPKTSAAVKVINDLGLANEGRVLFVLDESDANAALSFRNIPNVHVLPTGELNAYDVLVSDTVVFTQGALPVAEPHSRKKDVAKADKPAKATPQDAAPVETSADADFGADSHASLADGSMPEGFPVKGNADSMKFHQTGGRWYETTVAEVWFTTAEAASAAGFVEAGTKAAASTSEEDAAAATTEAGLDASSASEEDAAASTTEAGLDASSASEEEE